MPGYDDGKLPFGTSEMIHMITFEGWVDKEDWNDDIAVIRVERPVGALSSWHSMSWNESPNFIPLILFIIPVILVALRTMAKPCYIGLVITTIW